MRRKSGDLQIQPHQLVTGLRRKLEKRAELSAALPVVARDADKFQKVFQLGFGISTAVTPYHALNGSNANCCAPGKVPHGGEALLGAESLEDIVPSFPDFQTRQRRRLNWGRLCLSQRSHRAGPVFLPRCLELGIETLDKTAPRP